MMHFPKKPINKKAFRRSLWSSLSRVIGITLGVSSAGVIQKFMGDRLENWHTVLLMVVVSFAMMLFAEYERET